MLSKILPFAVLSAGLVLAVIGPVAAMAPASQPLPVDLGLEGGVTDIGTRASLSGAGDISVAIASGLVSREYTCLTVDSITVGSRSTTPAGRLSLSRTITTVGLRQPLDCRGPAKVALEGGASFFYDEVKGNGATIVNQPVNGYFGARISSEAGSITVNGMFRYHFLTGGFWQAGIGFTGPVAGSKRIAWQMDYYRTGGASTTGGASVEADSVLMGFRWSAG